MKGVAGIILGYVHHETGEYVAREEAERASTADATAPAYDGRRHRPARGQAHRARPARQPRDGEPRGVP